jgi:hypothetical protein
MAGRTQDRIDPHRRKLGLAVGKRRFQRALDRIGGNHHVGDLLGRDELFELAERHHLGLRHRRPELLESGDRHEGDQDVPYRPGLLSLLRIHGSAPFDDAEGLDAAGERHLARRDRERRCLRSTIGEAGASRGLADARPEGAPFPPRGGRCRRVQPG